MKYVFFYATLFFFFCSCEQLHKRSADAFRKMRADSLAALGPLKPDSLKRADSAKQDGVANMDTMATVLATTINTKKVHPEELLRYAETLIDVPYQYGSTNPKVGFDCSGFITHLFNHFGVSVPRSSIDFTNVGKEVSPPNAKRGDIILFTGTNPAERFVGHMGIVFSNADTLKFIHSSSGKANGVTITPLNEYYQTRFVKVVRIFQQNNE